MPRIFEKLLNLVSPFDDKDSRTLTENSIVFTPNHLEAVLRYGPYYAPEELSDTTDKYMQEGWGWYLEVGALDNDDKSKLAYYNHVPCTAATQQNLVYIGHMRHMEPVWWEAYVRFVDETAGTLKTKYPDKTRHELAATEGFTDLFIPHCHICGHAFDEDAEASKRYCDLTTQQAQRIFMEYHICLNCLTKGGTVNGN